MKENIKNLLRSLEKTSKKYWNISPEVGQFLNILIKNQGYKNILEIGTSNGYSGIWIAEALSHTNGHLYTIESNKKHRYPEALKNFIKSKLQKFITPILGHAPEDLPEKPKKLDLAFFDATKSEHLSYFMKIKGRIKKGGMIITDNVETHKKALFPYTKTIKKSPNWRSFLLKLGNGILISYKIR